MHQVDETLFVQILHAYSARNPMELILDDAYDSCLQGMLSAAGHRAPELQQRFGAKLFVKQRNDGQNVLVAGTKKRNQELIPLSRVLSTLQELAQDTDANATQLKQAVKAKVLGIPEEIVQEYCDMAGSSWNMDDPLKDKDDFKKCSCCGILKSSKSFTRHKDKPMGLRSRCKVCEQKARREKKEQIQEMVVFEEKTNLRRRKKKDSYLGLTGTAICAACGFRKAVFEFDKARQKPFTLRCHCCTAMDAPLMTKLCCSCMEELPLDRFYRDSYTKNGFRPRCMDCMKGRKGPGQSGDPGEGYLIDPGPKEEIEIVPIAEFAQVSVPRKSRSRRSRHKTETQQASTEESSQISPVAVRERRSGRRSRKAVEADMTDGLDPLLEYPDQEPCRKGDGRKNKTLTGCSTVTDSGGNITKYCTGCHEYKDAGEFGRDVSKPSGLRSRCRSCQKRSRGTASNEDRGQVVTQRKIPRKPLKKRGAKIEKQCTRCHETKPLGEFYKDKSKEDCLASICKKCAREAKSRSERNIEGRKSKTCLSKNREGRVQHVDENELQFVLNYVDALLPESSECSADAGDSGESSEAEWKGAASHRVCIGCKVDKNCVEFDFNPLLPDGLCPLCKECKRGNGMKGQRRTEREIKRCCLRCGKPKFAIQFAKSIFYPNRVSRICQECRSEEMPRSSIGRKRRKVESEVEPIDLIDFECDVIRVRDPGGGERLWRPLVSDSDSEEDTTRRQRGVNDRSEDPLATQLRSDGPKSLTITHHVLAGCDLPKKSEKRSEIDLDQYSVTYTKPVVIAEKQCKRCGETKPRDRFRVDVGQPARISQNCIRCSKDIEMNV